MPEQSDIRYGQGVWCLYHANGVIVDINYADQEVTVEWYNSKTRDIIEFDTLYGNWNWKAKQWQLTL